MNPKAICRGGPRHGSTFAPVNARRIDATGGYYLPTGRHDEATGLEVWDWHENTNRKAA